MREPRRSRRTAGIAVRFARNLGLLHMIVNMRSWDLVWGLSYDVPSFVSVQMMLAAVLKCGVGAYLHNAGSAHVYDRPDMPEVTRPDDPQYHERWD